MITFQKKRLTWFKLGRFMERKERKKEKLKKRVDMHFSCG